MESYSLVVVIITMYAGMFYVTGRWHTYMDKNGLKWFFFFTILIPNLAFLGYWLYYMYIEAIKVLYDKKQDKIVKFITCNKVKSQREFMKKYSSMH